MDRPTPTTAPPGPLRQLLAVALVLMLCLCLSAAVLVMGARTQAEQDARQYGQTLGRSMAILIQPLLLADDRISLNYLFNELQQQPRLNGLRLIDPRGLSVAVAGEQTGLQQTLELARGNATLGELTLWVDRQSTGAAMRQLLMEAGALALLSMAATLITLWLSLKRRRNAPEREASPTFSQVAASVTPTLEPLTDTEEPPAPQLDNDDANEDPDALPSLQPFAELPETPGAAAGSTATAQHSTSWPQRHTTASQETETAAEDSVLAPQVASWLRDEPTAPEATATSIEPQPSMPKPIPAPPDRDDNRDLVELLRPAHDRDVMPPFTPSDYQDEAADSDEAMVPDLTPVEFEEPDTLSPSEPQAPSNVSPLDKSAEEQLGLYTLEQELELMLAAEEAGYLFLIDASSARSENMEEDERARLMRPYRTLANSVAHIYGGRVDATPEGDLQLFFDTPSSDDSHGINALCSAMLFAYLYRHYNQHRIRQFRPVINLHLALVRGHHEKLERLLEEARFLTRTTESNELISHTALTEAPDFKNTLLEGADIRREDEDKVLIIRISKSYQELLEKQARHLLTKLQQREQGHR